MIQEKQLSEKARRVIRWRETLATLDDTRFFDIMRVYLGELRTPYNKDKLIEQLSSLFRKDQNIERIIAYLSEDDVKILTAVHFMYAPTQEKLTDFFKDNYKSSDLYVRLVNLTERLLLYSYYDSDAHDQIFDINPIIAEKLQPYLNLSVLFTAPEFAERNFSDVTGLSSQFVAALVSYLYENPELYKSGDSLKKRSKEQLLALFQEHFVHVQPLLNAFINLGLVKQGEKELSVDDHAFADFATLPEKTQYAFFAAAASVHLGRQSLKYQAQLLMDTIASVPESGFSKTTVMQIAFLIANQNPDSAGLQKQSRFSRMLSMHESGAKSAPSKALIDGTIENAITFGLFEQIGKTLDGVPILKPGAFFYKTGGVSERRGILNINAGTSVSILPGLSLAELLPLVQFMDIRRFDVVAEFEISKKSASRAFSKNISAQQLIQTLADYSAYKIPQNLEINLTEWQNSYQSALLYYGYVLTLDQKTERIFEQNPKMARYVCKKLGSGVFLLNIPAGSTADEFIQQSGLNLLAKPICADSKTSAGARGLGTQSKDSLGFPNLSESSDFIAQKTLPNSVYLNFEQNAARSKEIQREFLSQLEGLSLSDLQREQLVSRIRQNIVIVPEQLSPHSVKNEILEADGIQYSAKVRLLENAALKKNLVEIELPSERNAATLEKIFGTPLLLIKEENGALVKLAYKDKDDTVILPVSRISHIKIIKTSVFE